MPDRFDKYFWDGKANTSGPYRLRRIIEYASFPDLISYPFEEIKRFLPEISLDKLRTSEKRIELIRLFLPHLAQATDWDDLLKRTLKLH